MASMGLMNLSPATFLTSAFPVRVPNTSHFDSPRYRDLIGSGRVARPTIMQLKTELHE